MRAPFGLRMLPAGQRQTLGLALRFMAYLAVFAVAVEFLQETVATLYLWPVARIAAALLTALSVPTLLDASLLPLGFSELTVGTIVYRVTFDCTALFVLLALVAMTLAYPASVRARVRGVAIGVPAVFAFACLRLVTLGVVAYLQPGWIEVFHVYVMELATLGFALFVWKYWIDEVVHGPA